MTDDSAERDPAIGDTGPVEELRIGGSTALLGDEALDLSDVLNSVLDRGAVLHGEVTIAVADVDLIRLNLGLLLQAVATAEQRLGTGGAAAPRPAPMAGGSLAGGLGTVPYRGALLRPADPEQPPPRNAANGYAAPREAQREQSLNDLAQGLPDRINADSTGPETGLARLVLTLIEVLRKVLEHQAVRRMEGGRLTTDEVERLGLALARLNDRMGELKRVFGLSEEDLQIDLGPLGRLK
jgi:hypothetical protein